MMLLAFQDAPIASPWLVFPIALFAALVITKHLDSLERDAAVPVSRRRIRAANAGVMLLFVPIASHAFAMSSPARPRTFVLVWSAVVFLLFVMVMLAAVDMLNTWRLRHAAHRRLRMGLAGNGASDRNHAPDDDSIGTQSPA